MANVDRDYIFLSLALGESGSALRAMDEVERLASLRTHLQLGLERREFQTVFDYIRLALQFSSNVSKIFWPHKNAAERGVRLRALVGLADEHSLADRRLRIISSILMSAWTIGLKYPHDRSYQPRWYCTMIILEARDGTRW